jgi:hypothetical protein
MVSSAPISGGFTEAEVWTAASQTGAARADDTSGTVENFRNIIENGEISLSGVQVRLTFEGNSSGSYSFEGLTIGERSANDVAVAFTQLEYNGAVVSAGNPMTVGVGATVSTDWTVFSLDSSKDYLVHMWNSGGFANQSKWDEGAGTNSYLNVSADDYSQTLDLPAEVARDEIYNLSKIEVRRN